MVEAGMSKRSPSTIETAASQLRQIIMASEAGALLGSEEWLVEKLGVSRATVRQVARLLEREGLLRVRRGINGGYFAGRPTLDTVETAVSAYLDTLDMDVEDITAVASVLWVETVRRAAGLQSEASREVGRRLLDLVSGLRPDAPRAKVLEVERETRTAIFALTKARYIELIFQVNMTFARTRFPPMSEQSDPISDHLFVSAWRKAKIMELEAIIDGDAEMGVLAARHGRNLWHERVWRRRVVLREAGET